MTNPVRSRPWLGFDSLSAEAGTVARRAMARNVRTEFSLMIDSSQARGRSLADCEPHADMPSGRAGEVGGTQSGQEGLHHLAVHVGQAEVAALEAVGQLRVVEAQEVKDRRVQVVDVYLVLDNVEAQLVRGADGLAPLDPAPGQPHGEGVRVVVAAVVAPLHHGRA